MRVGLKEILTRPQLWPGMILAISSKDATKYHIIYNKIVEAHRKKIRTINIKQQDKIIDFICALHLRDENLLSSGVFEEFSWAYYYKNKNLRVRRAWIDAIQKELNLDLIPQELLELPKSSNSLDNIFSTIHYIHKATYNILKHKNLAPSFSLILRNIISLPQEIQLKGQLTKFPCVEYDEIKMENVMNIRCCSLKPHGCENYDFILSPKKRFVVMRGMEEKEFNNFECVMPTILYTLHHKNPQRYRGNVSQNEVIIISGDSLYNFFYLYEFGSL